MFEFYLSFKFLAPSLVGKCKKIKDAIHKERDYILNLKYKKNYKTALVLLNFSNNKKTGPIKSPVYV